MALTQASIVTLTVVAVIVVMFLVKRNRDDTKKVVVYTFGDIKLLPAENEDHHSKAELLHIEQVLRKAEGGDNLTKVNVEFPMNGRDYIIKLVKVTNYNAKDSAHKMARADKDDSEFWVLISEGAIGTNTIKLEINSYRDIDSDIEFFGFKNETITKPPHYKESL